MSQISFRSMQRADLTLVHTWLNQPHMRIYYQSDPISLETVREQYGARLNQNLPVFTHITMLDDHAIGKMQCYLIQDYPIYAKELEIANGISLDFFIGDAQFIGQGIGRQMLKQYVEQIAFPSFPNEQAIYVCHERNNKAAIASSQSVGFQYLRNVVEEGKESMLFVLRRS